ncbi:HD domain-containing protein [Methylosinus sp. LW4]|uniref:HD domain-containing protein n=1 Tax=Methylosinus sp. LW4 TaxID=136993 RepID=UPI0003A0847B
MPFKSQRVRCPLHNLIAFPADDFHDALWHVVQTRAFQRLRRVKQLGFSDLVYPGATHSRFAHSLGVFHIARRLMQIIEAHMGSTRYRPYQADAAVAAALVHDLGHGPFSHAFEDVGRRLKLKMADHEHVSDALIRDGDVADALNQLGSGFANDVAAIVKGGPRSLYGAVVSSQFDADRLDYMRRDRLMTGTQHGAIDFEWLIANIEIGEVPYGVDEQELGKIETFVLGPKAVFAAEAYVVGLFQLYPTVYFHKATRGAEKLFTELLLRAFELLLEGEHLRTGLPENHPLVRFIRNPNDIECVLSLDDTVVWGALPLFADAPDAALGNLARRLRDRKFYKSLNVREQIANALGAERLEKEACLLDQLSDRVEEKISEWVCANGCDLPRILVDRAEREPYKKLQESKGPLNQIRIRTADDRLVDLGERSRIVRGIEPFRLFRVYAAAEDGEARDLVKDLIRGEIKNAAGK